MYYKIDAVEHAWYEHSLKKRIIYNLKGEKTCTLRIVHNLNYELLFFSFLKEKKNICTLRIVYNLKEKTFAR